MKCFEIDRIQIIDINLLMDSHRIFNSSFPLG